MLYALRKRGSLARSPVPLSLAMIGDGTRDTALSSLCVHAREVLEAERSFFPRVSRRRAFRVTFQTIARSCLTALFLQVKQNLKQLPSDNIARFVDPQTRKAFLEPWRQHCKAFDRLKNPSKAARETAASLKAFYHSQLSLFVEAAEEPGEAYEVVQKEFADFVDDWAQKEAMEKFLELGERGEERATGLPPKGKEEEEESERGSESAAKRRRPDATAESGKAAAKKSKTGAGKNNKKVVSSGSSSAAAGAAAGAAAQMGKGKTASKGKAWGDGRGEKRLTQRAPASDPATKAAKRKAGASVRSGTGAAVDVADDDGDLLQRFTATPASFAKQSAALEGAADIVRNAELAAGSDPAALKAALAMSRALVQGLDRLVRMGAEVVTALTTASESSSGATPTKFSGGRGSRNVLSKVTSRLDDLAVEMSLFPDAWEENGKTGVAVVLQEGNGRLVTEKQITGHVGKIRTHVATVVQNFVARQIGTAFPVYKERSDPTSKRARRVL